MKSSLHVRLTLAALAFSSVVFADVLPSTATFAGLLTESRAAQSRQDVAGAFHYALAAFAQRPTDPSARAVFQEAGRRLAKRMESDRREERRRAVRDAERSVRRRAEQEKGLRARCREAEAKASDGRTFEAAFLFHQLLSESPGFDRPRRGLDRVQRTLERLRRRGKFPQESVQIAVEGLYRFNQGDWDAAARFLEDAQASSVNDPMMKNGHVADFAALARGHAEKRAWNIQRAKVLEQARAAQQAGRPAEARRLLQSILDQDPSDQDARAALAGLTDILVAVKNTFQEESRRKEIGERMSRGTTLLIQERYTDALEQFSRVLELDPEHRDAREQSQEVRRIMRGQGLYIPPVLEGTPAEAAYREGLRLYGNEDLPGARAAFEKALTLDPKHGAARQALQRILKD